MSKLYLVETNARKEIWSIDTINRVARVISNKEIINMKNLKSVEDDSSWEEVNFSKLKKALELQYSEPHNFKILDTKVLK